MRRLLIPTAALLVLSACTSGSSGSSPAPAGVAPAPAAGSAAPSASPEAPRDTALRDDTRAICDQAERVGADAGRNFVADLKLLADAESAEDAAAATKAREKTTRDVQNYASALLDMAGLANDAGLKEALSQMAKEVSAIEGDVRKMDADKLAALQGELTAVCGSD